MLLFYYLQLFCDSLMTLSCISFHKRLSVYYCNIISCLNVISSYLVLYFILTIFSCFNIISTISGFGFHIFFFTFSDVQLLFHDRIFCKLFGYFQLFDYFRLLRYFPLIGYFQFFRQFSYFFFILSPSIIRSLSVLKNVYLFSICHHFSHFQVFSYFQLFGYFYLFRCILLFSVVRLFYLFCYFKLICYFQLFGYFQSAAEEHEEAAGVGEEVSIFTVSKRRRVGEAAGMPGQLFFLWSTFYNYILEKLVFKLLIYSVLQRNVSYLIYLR